MAPKSSRKKHSSKVNPKRKKISSAEKSDIFCMDDETRSTHSSDAEKTNKQKVSNRLSVENINIKKRLSISSDLLSNISISLFSTII